MLASQLIDAVVRASLIEDAPQGDLTSLLLLPAAARASASLVARQGGVFSGGAVFEAAMRLTDSTIGVELLITDGGRFEPGTVLARAQGRAASVLQAERVALNFVQRMSGIATQTASYVAAVAGTRARIVDTRKTTPGLRAFERAAVRDGGGHNHRFGLSDAVLVKDNHLAVLEEQGVDVATALRDLRSRLSHTTHVEVEVDRIDQVEAAVEGGADTILLDNFSLDELRAGVALIDGRAGVEASGNVDLDTVAAIAGTGVDLISVGALTHTVRAIDLGLDIVVTS
jgi:nicotinate-nucleotide pyrophosphorylase (carboxylating)